MCSFPWCHPGTCSFKRSGNSVVLKKYAESLPTIPKVFSAHHFRKELHILTFSCCKEQTIPPRMVAYHWTLHRSHECTEGGGEADKVLGTHNSYFILLRRTRSQVEPSWRSIFTLDTYTNDWHWIPTQKHHKNSERAQKLWMEISDRNKELYRANFKNV